MGKIIALLGIVLIIAALAFLSTDPALVQRRADQTFYEAERQRIELERLYAEAERERARADASLPGQIVLDWLGKVGTVVIAGGVIYIVYDTYRRRAARTERAFELVSPDERGLMPAPRKALEDQQLVELVARALALYHETKQTEARHQPGQAPAHFTYSPTIHYEAPIAAATAPAMLVQESDEEPLTLPDEVALADVLDNLAAPQLAYGVLPGGDLLRLPIAAGYHALGHGDTRTGKTNWIDGLICQIHHKARHYKLEVVAGDFKRELAATWNRSPLLPHGVCKEPAEIVDMLEAMASAISERYDLFERTGLESGRIVRGLGDYARATGKRLPLTFIVVDEINALIEAVKSSPKKRTELTSALKRVLQTGAGAGYFVLGGAQYLLADLFSRDGSKQFVTRAHFGVYDQMAIRVMFGGTKLQPDALQLLTGQQGRGLIRTAGQPYPMPFQALRCDEEDIIDAIRTVGGDVSPRTPEAPQKPQEGVRSDGRDIREIAKAVLQKRKEAPEVPLAEALSAENLAALREEVQHRARSESKTATISALWRTTGGTSFSLASRLYNELIELES